MDNQRLLVWAAFGLLAFMTWEAWMQDYGPQPATELPAVSQGDARPVVDDDLPTVEASDDLPAAPAPAMVDTPDEAETGSDSPTIVTVSTDVLYVEISTRGATLQRADLSKYPVDKERPDEPITLLSTRPQNLGLLQTGLLNAEQGAAAANHNATFVAERDSYALTGDEIVVPFTWTDGSGVTVTKRFRFRRGSYEIDVEQLLTNDSPNDWQGAQYAQIQRRSFEPERSMFDVDTYSFDGPIIYDGEKSEKLDRDDLLDRRYEFNTADGWLAAIQHHFLSAVVPPAEAEFAFAVGVSNNAARASAVGPSVTVAAGSERTFTNTLFIGPKLQEQLEEIAESLLLTVDYGWLTIISEPLFWLLSLIFDWVGNWGLAIIIVTILIKLAFYKLTEKSGRSMAKMRKIQPRMKALQERYKDDRQQLSQQMMELYKREKVNPAAGCLPILVQMPFFLAFYWVLLESVEMRQAPFAGWITDLSSRDPYFILPIIMGAAMLFQQKLNPAPADPVQAKVMQIMPIVFTVFFAFFPSGLVLYWVTNTILSIAQQWHVNKVVEEEDRRKSGKKPRKNRDKDKT